MTTDGTPSIRAVAIGATWRRHTAVLDANPDRSPGRTIKHPWGAAAKWFRHPAAVKVGWTDGYRVVVWIGDVGWCKDLVEVWLVPRADQPRIHEIT